MPIFRFHCTQCDADFELLLSGSNAGAKCPKCGSLHLVKALNRVAVKVAGPKSCASRNDCPSAGKSGCGCGGGCCGGHHNH